MRAIDALDAVAIFFAILIDEDCRAPPDRIPADDIDYREVADLPTAAIPLDGPE